jgi:hypothetical protein
MKTPLEISNIELLKAAFPDCRKLDAFLSRNGADMKYIYTAFEMLKKAHETKKQIRCST